MEVFVGGKKKETKGLGFSPIINSRVITMCVNREAESISWWINEKMECEYSLGNFKDFAYLIPFFSLTSLNEEVEVV